MKKKYIPILFIVPCLAGCSLLLPHHSSSSESSLNNSSNSSESSNNSSSSSNSNSLSSSQDDNPIKTIEIYATNDIHGAVKEEYVNNADRMGMAKLATFMNERGKEANTILLDQGDTWQGTIYSNDNRGELITDLMNYVHYDARTIGNHDFDWGSDYIIKNRLKNYDGYSTPVLAGNVYDYNFDKKEMGTEQQKDLGVKSVTYTLDNGLKVGILGGIGSSQITSICTNFVKNYGFSDHIKFVKDEATYLREEENCDVIIACIHEGASSMRNNDLNKYVDLVLCGHTHKTENYNEGYMHLVQSGRYSEEIGHITLTYNTDSKTLVDTSVSFLENSDVTNNIKGIDPTIQGLIDKYEENCSEDPDEIVASNVSSYFPSTTTAANLMANAIMEEAIDEGFNVDLAYTNQARASLPSGSWTYSDLFTSFPFDNDVYVMNITGQELLEEIVPYNNICRNPSFTSNGIDPDGIYSIACIDYLAVHVNDDREYDYFPYGANNVYNKLNKSYRYILKDWLTNNGYNSGKSISSYDYANSVWAHDKSVFYSV